MEIYSDLSSAASKEFEQLLNTHQSKTPIEEGKIIEGVINKITEKYVFLYIENLKSNCLIKEASLIFTIPPEYILSRIRGTAGKIVG